MHHLIGQNGFRPGVKENQKFAIGILGRTVVGLKGDNQAALSLIQDAHTHDRSKHIDIAYHYVRQLWKTRKISVEYVPSNEMIADGLTKPISGPGFQRFVHQLGLQ